MSGGFRCRQSAGSGLVGRISAGSMSLPEERGASGRLRPGIGTRRCLSAREPAPGNRRPTPGRMCSSRAERRSRTSSGPFDAKPSSKTTSGRSVSRCFATFRSQSLLVVPSRFRIRLRRNNLPAFRMNQHHAHATASRMATGGSTPGCRPDAPSHSSSRNEPSATRNALCRPSTADADCPATRSPSRKFARNYFSTLRQPFSHAISRFSGNSC